MRHVLSPGLLNRRRCQQVVIGVRCPLGVYDRLVNFKLFHVAGQTVLNRIALALLFLLDSFLHLYCLHIILRRAVLRLLMNGSKRRFWFFLRALSLLRNELVLLNELLGLLTHCFHELLLNVGRHSRSG